MYKKLLISCLSIFCTLSIFTSFPFVSFAQEKLTIQKEGDVEVISNPKHPIPEDGLRKRIVIEEELSIGVEDGDENYMFSGVICFRKRFEPKFHFNGKWMAGFDCVSCKK